MESLLKVPANAIDRLTPDALSLDCALRARGMDDVADELLLAKLEPGIVGVQLTGVQSVDPPIFGAQYPLDHPYAKGKAINLGVTTLASSATATADLVTAGYQYLTVLARIGNGTTPATASGDMSFGVQPYEDDGVVLWPNNVGGGGNLAPDAVVRAAALGANMASVIQRFVLAGIDKVNIRLQNNNVAALQGAMVVYYLQK